MGVCCPARRQFRTLLYDAPVAAEDVCQKYDEELVLFEASSVLCDLNERYPKS